MKTKRGIRAQINTKPSPRKKLVSWSVSWGKDHFFDWAARQRGVFDWAYDTMFQEFTNFKVIVRCWWFFFRYYRLMSK
jgi:hypothetical protein